MVIKMQFGKRILLLLCAVLMLFSMFPAIRSGASTGHVVGHDSDGQRRPTGKQKEL